MAGNTIKGAEGIRQLTDLYNALSKQIDLATKETKEFLSSTQKLPSEYIKAIEKLRTTQSGLGVKLDEVTAKQKKLTAEQKESARIANQKVKISAQLTKATKKEALELAKLQVELRQVRRNAREIAIVSSSLSNEFEKQAIRLVRLRRRYKGVALAQGENSKAALRLKGRIDRLDASTKRVKDSVSIFRRNMNSTTIAMRSAVRGARALASAMGIMGGAFLIVSVVRQAFNTLREFDRQAIAVQKTTELTSEQIKIFKQDVIDLALSIRGLSIQGLLKSSEVAGQLGIKGSKNILAFAKSVELLKISAKGIGEESVAQFAKFIEVSKDSAENADRLASVITDLGNNFATTEKEIIKSAVEIQKGTQLYNISAQAVLGLAAASSSLGVQDQAARTSIRKTLGVLQQAIFTGKNLTQVLQLTGLSEKELSEQFEKDASSVLLKFLKGLKSINDAGGNTSLILDEMKLAGDRVAPTILSLAEKHERTAEAINRANAEYDANEAALREAGLAAQSLDVHIKDLGKSWDALILSIEKGDGILASFLKKTIIAANAAIKFFLITTRDFTKEAQTQIKLREELIKLTLAGNDATTTELEIIQQIGRINSLNNKELRDAILAINEKAKAEEDRIKLIEQILALEKNTLSQAELEKKSLEELITLLSSLTAIRENTIVTLEGSVKAYKKLISELETERDMLATNSNQYEAYNKQIEAAEKNIKQLTEAIKAVNELQAVSPFGIDEDEILKSTEALQKAKDDERLLEIQHAQAIQAIREGTLEHAGALTKEQTAIIKDALDLQLRLEQEFEESKKDLIFEGIEGIFEARVNAVDREIEENRRVFADLLNNANLTEEQRSQLEAERDQKEEELLKKKQEREQQAFIVQQGLAVAEIALNLAQTITAINLAAAAIDAITLGIGGAIYRAANIPIAIGTAAAQTGIVLAQTIAGFKEGGIAPGGKILVNDSGTTSYKEVIRTPDGKVSRPQERNTVISPPKGTEIFKSESEFTRQLNKELAFNGILPIVNKFSTSNNNSLNDDRIVDELKSLKKVIKTADTSQIIFDERGISKYIKRNDARIKILNNRFIGKGKKI